MLWACSQPLPMHQNLPKTAKICPITISLRNYEIPPKIEILVFFYIKKCFTYRRGTRACIHHLDFQYKNFSYAFFVAKNRPLYVNFSMPPCGNWCFSQGSTSLVGMKFCKNVSNSLRNKNLKRLIPNLLEKSGFFGFQNTTASLGNNKKKLFLQLWMLRNECLRGGVYVNI